jgi:hypothetical protein
MSGTTGSRDVDDKLATPPAQPSSSGAEPDRFARLLSWSAVAGIVIALLLMIVASLVRNSWEHPYIVLPSGGFPWALSVHRSLLPEVSAAMWAAALLGGAGVAAGLAALSRGARPPIRPLLAAGLVAAVAFTVTPPTGSTDALDYAAYGRIVVLGHSPYVETPAKLRSTGDPVGKAIGNVWRRQVTVYGPLASAEQWAAAELGGTSAARIIFWLKLWTTIAFGAVVLALDRLTRGDPQRRLRAHLLWSVNPLLLWVLVAAGHVDVLAAAAGFFGLLALRRAKPGEEPGALQGFAAGLLVGVAADVKIIYLLLGVGVAWAARRSIGAWLGVGAGAAIALLPAYAWFGVPAFKALLKRDANASVDNFYQLFVGSHNNVFPHQLLVAALLLVAVAALLLWRLPDGVLDLPAIRPALAVSLAWLFIWSYQYPWYDSMAFCLLALYPASRIDWLALARLTAATFALMPGNAVTPPQHWLQVITNNSVFWWAPVVLLAAAVALVWLGVTNRWKMDPAVSVSPLGQPLRA